MEVMDRPADPVAVRRLDNGPVIGFQLEDTTVVFQRNGQRASGAVTFRSAGSRFLAADLVAGRWRILRDGVPAGSAVEVTPEAGVLWFEGPPGAYRLQPERRP
jgi:hypothetical protein